VLRTVVFVVARLTLGLIDVGPAPDAKDVETAVLLTSWWRCAARPHARVTSRPTG
jgi:hypothetical protein